MLDDSKNKIEPGSHKDNPKHVDDDDDKDAEKVDKDEGGEIGSLETSTEEMQTPIPTPLRSPRTILSLDKNINHELKDNGVSQLAGKATEVLIENNLKPYIDATIIEDHIHHIHYDHQEDDAPPKGEKRVKRHKASKSSKTARGSSSKHSAKDSTTYDETLELITELQDVNKRVLTIFDYERMKATLNDALNSWHKRVYNQNQRSVRNNPEDYFSTHRITKVVRITADQPHGLDFMEQITVMRENDKPGSFSEADFKYLNKNDIEDLYYLCRNKKFGNRELPNQGQLNYTNIDISSKDEKWVMYLTEIVKFCYATLEKVLKDVKLKIFQSEPWRKPPSLSELDRDILREFEREITKRLSHREQMRRW
ncbi:hypothetical protein Tco_1033273 [Tanacetum coccineum]|uniref:Uncharacterized protein n=1 Tax=Tanacetum coccineum TaxID=301880 RepID=A0ABQ5GGH8_9ASTR